MPRKKHRGISLPWENPRQKWRAILARRRKKFLIVCCLVLPPAWVILRAAENRERIRMTRIAISQVRTAIAEFEEEFGRCPRSKVELVHPPRTAVRFLWEMPKDGWERDLWIECPSRHDPQLADVVSAGTSGSFFVDGHIY